MKKDFKYWLYIAYYITLFLFLVSSVWIRLELSGNVFLDYMSEGLIVYITTLLIMLKYAHIEGKMDGLSVLRGERIEHNLSALARVCTVVLIGYLLNFHNIFGIIKGFLLEASILAAFSIWFDLRYNYTTGSYTFHVGTTSLMDKTFGKAKWVFNLAVFALGIYLIGHT